MVDRLLPTDEAVALLELTTELADAELAPRVGRLRGARRVPPRACSAPWAGPACSACPTRRSTAAARQPYEVYLQVLEILASRWLTVAEAVSVHTLACYPLATYGSDAAAQAPPARHARRRAARRVLPVRTPGRLRRRRRCAPGPSATATTYVVTGTKAWITHAGVADFYNVFCRTGGAGAGRDLVPARRRRHARARCRRPGRRTMGLRSSPVAQIVFDDARVPADQLIGEEGAGFRIAMSALDSGRLGIAACAVGLAQARAGLRRRLRPRAGAVRPARSSTSRGSASCWPTWPPRSRAARALTLHAARLRDAGRPYRLEAAKAKLFATDMAMRVTTDAVQVLGGYGYVSDHPVERYLREAKVLQIVEGTNQIQRLVIARALARPLDRSTSRRSWAMSDAPIWRPTS